MPYLIAIDSDETLRHSDGTITNNTKKVIKKVQDEGNIVVIATARPRYHTSDISKQVGINKFMISSNGAEVYDAQNDEIIYANYIPYKLCIDIYNKTKLLNLRTMFVCDNTEYVTLFSRNDQQILLNDDNISELENKNIKQIMIISENKNDVLSYKNEIEKNNNLKVVDSSNNDKKELWFSIVNSKASKGDALEKLASYLNISIKNTIAFGNDNNDLSMIKIAGIGVAVKNANKEVLNNANYITKSNDEDGVAYYLENIFLNNSNN